MALQSVRCCLFWECCAPCTSPAFFQASDKPCLLQAFHLQHYLHSSLYTHHHPPAPFFHRLCIEGRRNPWSGPFLFCVAGLSSAAAVATDGIGEQQLGRALDVMLEEDTLSQVGRLEGRGCRFEGGRRIHPSMLVLHDWVGHIPAPPLLDRHLELAQ